MNSGLISNPSIRAARNEEKKQLLLEWLVDFTWTTPPIAGHVMGVTSRGAINKSLTQLEHRGVIRSAKIQPITGRTLRIVGITPDGLLWCDNNESACEKPTFDPARVALSTAQHRLDVQECRLKVRDADNFSWIAENNYPKELTYRPDAIIKTANKSIALELERTAKTRKRYQQLVVQHLRQIKQGLYDEVHYVSTLNGFAERLERLFFSIKKVPVKGQQVLFSGDLKQRFKFSNLDDWSIQ